MKEKAMKAKEMKAKGMKAKEKKEMRAMTGSAAHVTATQWNIHAGNNATPALMQSSEWNPEEQYRNRLECLIMRAGRLNIHILQDFTSVI